MPEKIIIIWQSSCGNLVQFRSRKKRRQHDKVILQTEYKNNAQQTRMNLWKSSWFEIYKCSLHVPKMYTYVAD